MGVDLKVHVRVLIAKASGFQHETPRQFCIREEWPFADKGI